MSRGPSPTPTATLKLRGSPVARERVKNGEPSGEEATGQPGSLAGAALETWYEVYPLVSAMGVLRAGDERALRRYCRLAAQWEQLANFLDECGTIQSSEENRDHSRPEWNQWTTITDQLLRIEVQFGLTPAARARVRVEKAPAAQGKEKYFRRSG